MSSTAEKLRLGRWSWEYFRERRDDRKRYIELFKKRKQQQQFSAEESADIEALEQRLDYEDLRFWRSLGRNQLKKENAAALKSKPAQPQQQGWLAWAWGSKPAEEQHSDMEENTQITEEQKKELYDAIDWDEKTALAESVDVPRDSVKMQVEASLSTGSFTLKKNHNGKLKDLISLHFDVFKAKALQRPRRCAARSPVRRLVAGLLNRFLGMYVNNFDPKQLKVGIWSGDVKLRNLQLRKEALDQLKLPINVLEGHLGELTLIIPWSNLSGAPVKVFIEDVFLLASPKEDAAYDEDEEERRKQRIKMEKLDSAELLKERSQEGLSSEEQKKNQSFTQSLVTKIVDNLQVTIKNIHVRYEDSISTPGHPFALGVTLQEFSAVSTNGEWTPTFIQDSTKSTHKLAKLGALAVYWNTDTELYGPGREIDQEDRPTLTHEEMVANFKGMIAKPDEAKPDYQFVLRPVSGQAKIVLDKTGLTSIHVDVEPLILRLSLRDILLALQIASKATELSGNQPQNDPKPSAVDEKARQLQQAGLKQRTASGKGPSTLAARTRVTKSAGPGAKIAAAQGSQADEFESDGALQKPPRQHEELTATIDGIRIVLIGDTHELPIFDLGIKSLTATAEDWSSNLKAGTARDARRRRPLECPCRGSLLVSDRSSR
ncbi:hypothetical protein BN1723_003552 [Verticillium longisporum]|uniref:Chorein N-terminal domain-containing protein n=1 Tax=Verticillium longisporum TaxID=100787 RepID=A0A0G4M2G1_VERLO|nr:hypothetical protein BN1723_003552 [Verticillium longisporum]